MLLHSCGFTNFTFPCEHLQRHLGAEWTEPMSEPEGAEEVKTFEDSKGA